MRGRETYRDTSPHRFPEHDDLFRLHLCGKPVVSRCRIKVQSLLARRTGGAAEAAPTYGQQPGAVLRQQHETLQAIGESLCVARQVEIDRIRGIPWRYPPAQHLLVVVRGEGHD